MTDEKLQELAKLYASSLKDEGSHSLSVLRSIKEEYGYEAAQMVVVLAAIIIVNEF